MVGGGSRKCAMSCIVLDLDSSEVVTQIHKGDESAHMILCINFLL